MCLHYLIWLMYLDFPCYHVMLQCNSRFNFKVLASVTLLHLYAVSFVCLFVVIVTYQQ